MLNPNLMLRYYDLVEKYDRTTSKEKLVLLEKELESLSQEDEFYFDPKNLLILVKIELNKEKEARQLVEQTYKEVVEFLKEKKIEQLDYIDLNDRHIFRILNTCWLLFSEWGKHQEAVKVLKILKKIDKRKYFLSEE